MPYYPPTSIGILLSTYAGTDTWDSTPPSGASTKQYAWAQVGNTVTLTIMVVYATQGTTNTLCTFTFPTDCPTPAVISGQGDAASEIMYQGFGSLTATLTQIPGASNRAWMQRNAANNGFEIAVSNVSLSGRIARATIVYRTL